MVHAAPNDHLADRIRECVLELLVERGPGRSICPSEAARLLSGRMGQVEGGFPLDVRNRILRGEKPLTGRPGESLPPADLAKTRQAVAAMMEDEPTDQNVVSYLMYPQVFEQFADHQRQFSDVSVLPTPVFFHGMNAGDDPRTASQVWTSPRYNSAAAKYTGTLSSSLLVEGGYSFNYEEYVITNRMASTRRRSPTRGMQARAGVMPTS